MFYGYNDEDVNSMTYITQGRYNGQSHSMLGSILMDTDVEPLCLLDECEQIIELNMSLSKNVKALKTDNIVKYK